MMPFHITRSVYLQSYKTDGVVKGRKGREGTCVEGICEDIQSTVTEERRKGMGEIGRQGIGHFGLPILKFDSSYLLLNSILNEEEVEVEGGMKGGRRGRDRCR